MAKSRLKANKFVIDYVARTTTVYFYVMTSDCT